MQKQTKNPKKKTRAETLATASPLPKARPKPLTFVPTPEERMKAEALVAWDNRALAGAGVKVTEASMLRGLVLKAYDVMQENEAAIRADNPKALGLGGAT